MTAVFVSSLLARTGVLAGGAVVNEAAGARRQQVGIVRRGRHRHRPRRAHVGIACVIGELLQLVRREVILIQ